MSSDDEKTSLSDEKAGHAAEILEAKISALMASIPAEYVISKTDLEPQRTDKKKRNAMGGYSDIEFMTLKPSSRNPLPRMVAVKRLKRNKDDVKKHFRLVAAREAYVWFKLQPHGNILEFTGCNWDFQDDKLEGAVFVSPSFENGSAEDYFKEQKLPALDVKRLEILDGACKGLNHMHSQRPPIAHGDIKAANILIRFDGEPGADFLRLRAVLCDFGRARIAGEDVFDHNKTGEEPPGYGRWTSPEDLAAKHVTKSSGDMWSFGWLVWEVMTERLPWPTFPTTNPRIISAIKKCKVPLLDDDKSSNLTSLATLKRCVEDCWKMEPEKRGGADSCLKDIQNAMDTLKTFGEDTAAAVNTRWTKDPKPEALERAKPPPPEVNTLNVRKAVQKNVPPLPRPDGSPPPPPTSAEPAAAVKALNTPMDQTKSGLGCC